MIVIMQESLFLAPSNVKVFRSKPHRMLANKNLCWLNSSVQLVLSNIRFVDALIDSSFFKFHARISDGKMNLISFDQLDMHKELADFYPSLERVNYNYLLNILKTPIDKDIGELPTRTYVDDIRKQGPKYNVPRTRTYLPMIEAFGETSCVFDYLSNILIPSISHLIDIATIYQDHLTCSSCDTVHVFMTEQFSVLPLLSTNCNGMRLPTAALERYFLSDPSAPDRTCMSCGVKSREHEYKRNIVQLPDTFLMKFSGQEHFNRKDGSADAIKCFMENKLDMSGFLANDLICSPSYCKFEFQSMIITTTSGENNRHFYTIAKYDDQFYRCDDAHIEVIDRSFVFERSHSIVAAMFVRAKPDPVNFVSMLNRIISAENEQVTPTNYSMQNQHVKMVFQGALEHVASTTNKLTWNYIFTFNCMQCRESNH